MRTNPRFDCQKQNLSKHLPKKYETRIRPSLLCGHTLLVGPSSPSISSLAIDRPPSPLDTYDDRPNEKVKEMYVKSIFRSSPPGDHRGQVGDVRGRRLHHQHHLRRGERAARANGGNCAVEAQRKGK